MLPYSLPQRGLAAVAVDVCDGVQPGEEDALLGGAAADVHHRVEQVGAALAALRSGGRQLGFGIRKAPPDTPNNHIFVYGVTI